MFYIVDKMWSDFWTLFQVKYTVRFGDAGQIVGVMVSFVLGAVDKNALPIQQEFQITFVQVHIEWICERFVAKLTF